MKRQTKNLIGIAMNHVLQISVLSFTITNVNKWNEKTTLAFLDNCFMANSILDWLRRHPSKEKVKGEIIHANTGPEKILTPKEIRELVKNTKSVEVS